ncbi:MAG: alpha/beta hydrolase [Betaproteobacteria bacterium]|nr:alpha/beta hydrolase [Betaproteobacteria bacterium]
MDLERLPGGAPALVFIHGFACTRADWKAQLEHFRSRAETLALDLRGHGATPGTPEECSIETYGADVAAVVEQSGLERAVLVGHSMGCRVVLEANRRAPERIAGLVLIDGSRMGTGDPTAAEENARKAFAATGYPVFARKFFADMFLADADPALKARTIEQALRLPEQIGKTLFPRVAGWDARAMDAALDAVRAPLMVIQSTYLNSERVRVAITPGQSTPWIELICSRVPAARIEIITGTGHFPQLEAPAKVSALVEDFRAQLALRGTP